MGKSYTYAIARARALEAKLVSNTQLSRMIEATDFDRAFFVLSETHYGDYISGSADPFNFDETIIGTLSKMRDFINYHAGGSSSLKTWWRKYDYLNVKILLRRFLRKDETEFDELSTWGTVPKELIFSYIIKGEGLIPKWLEMNINKAILAFEEEKSILALDDVLDNAFLDDLMSAKSKLLRGLARLWKSSNHPFDLSGDNKTIDVLKGTKRMSFGIDPLIAFWLVLEMEAKGVRSVLRGKIYRLGPTKIKERLRESYV